MSQAVLLFFLTLVLHLSSSIVLAAPHQHSSQDEDEESTDEVKQLDPNLSLSEPTTKATKKNWDETNGIEYYPYRQALIPRLGMYFDGDDNPYFLGFLYLVPNRRSPQLEAGADIISDSRGHLNAALRFTYNEFSYFRPFYKAGVTCEVDPGEQLASLADIKSYYLRGGLGLEYTFRRPMSLRVELEGALSLENTVYFISGGYSWAW